MEHTFNLPMPEKFTATKNSQGNYKIVYDQQFEDKKNNYNGKMILPNCKISFDVFPDVNCNNEKPNYFEFTIYEDENDFCEQEAEFVYKNLLPFGIDIKDKNKQFRPFNEVMVELGAYLKNIRRVLDEKQFEIQRQYILKLCSGNRYMTQFMS